MAPKKPTTRLTRALEQRFFYLSHRYLPSNGKDNQERIAFLITGSSGNIYTVNLPNASKKSSLKASCNCVDQRIRKTVCKHMFFVFLRVLKLPLSEIEGDDGDQSEDIINENVNSYSILKKVYTMGINLPPRGALSEMDPASAPESVRNAAQMIIGDTVNPINNINKEVAQKPIQDDDECPICFENLDEEELLYCKYSCGNSVHKECFEKYTEAAKNDDQHIRCVLCRSVWDPREATADTQVKIGRRGLLQRGRLVDLGEIVPDEFEFDRNGRRRIEEQDDEEYEPEKDESEEEIIGSNSRKRRKVEAKMIKQKKEEDTISPRFSRYTRKAKQKKEEQIEDIQSNTNSIGNRRSARLAQKMKINEENEKNKIVIETRSRRKRRNDESGAI